MKFGGGHERPRFAGAKVVEKVERRHRNDMSLSFFHIKKVNASDGRMPKKPYLCKPIITTRAHKRLAICVLIAFPLAWERG